MPFFNLHTFLLLYHRWKIYPAILRELNVVCSGLKKRGLGEDFWNLVIRISGTDKASVRQQEARMMLLTCMINLDVLDNNDRNKNHSIIHAILNRKVRTVHQLTLKCNLKDDNENPYWMLFEHLLQMKRNGVPAFEINKMIETHHDALTLDFHATNENRDFIKVLYEKLPPNFMIFLYHHQIAKLNFIYQHNPNLFLNWEPVIGDELCINQLIHSLFATFSIPKMFIVEFCKDTLTAQEKEWFAHVVKGKNLVSADGLPLFLTKKAAHLFCTMEPIPMPVNRAIIYASIQVQINDDAFSYQVVNSIRDSREVPFWVQTMTVLNKKGLTSQYVTEVMDYIGHRVFEERATIDFKRKKIQNLINDVHQWHRELNEASLSKKYRQRMPDAGIDDLKIEIFGAEYEISQIRKVIDLYHEGKELQHCVFTYKAHCFRRRCYIFSLKALNEEEQKTSLITIELRGTKIVQAKGKHNRQPNDLERDIIRIWAKERALSFAA